MMKRRTQVQEETKLTTRQTIAVLFTFGLVAGGVYLSTLPLRSDTAFVQPLPLTVSLDVPFTPQSPGGEWIEPWQNACEETSIVMIDNFYQNKDLDAKKAQDEIVYHMRKKEEVFGQSLDESVQTMVDMINTLQMPWRAWSYDNPSINDLKRQMLLQRPVIIPVYARALKNPYYIDGGPDYHTIVLVGYDDSTQEFIVHDPGTRRGEDFRYEYLKVMNAIHDLDTQNYENGAKRVLYTALRDD